MSVISNNQLAGASGQGGSSYEISKSLRFNSGDSAYLSRTSSAGNQKTWTWSGWVKRSVLDGTGFDVYFCRFIDSSNFAILGTYRDAVNDIGLTVKTSGSNVIRVTTNGLFRDTSAWFHLVCAVDTTAATASDRVKIYINGVLQTSLNSSTYGNQNTDTHINSAGEHRIGANNSYYTNGYLADVHFVDGVSGLTASDFGEYDDNNVWVAKQYTGSYGTNGFHLDFNDTSSNSALGTDAAGSNDWTVHNFSSASTAPVAKSSISYAIAPTDFPGTATNNQSSLSFNNTWDVGASLTTGSYIIIDTGAKGHTVDLTPSSSDASNSYSDDLINWTTGASSTANSSYNEGRYYWIQSAPSGYGGGLTLTSASTADGDSTIDTPMNLEADSGNNPGNYATMNPVGRTDSVYFTEDGNLTCGNSSVSSKSSGSRGYIPSTIGFKSGKWYCEVRTTAASDGDVDFAVGIYPATSTGYYSTSGHYAIRPTGHIYSPSGAHQSYGSTWTDTDIIGIAVDMDSSTKTVQFFKNGSSMASATTIADKEYFFGYGSDGGGSSRTYKATWNFGQRPFKYPPGGTGGPAATFKSLCTQNLPDPTIADGSTGFDTKTWSGNNSSTNSTPRNVDTYKFSPDLVWIKNINSTEPHNIYDTVRGEGKYLYPHDTNQGNDAGNYGLTGFLSNGFSLLDQGPGYWSVNADTRTYVGWAWDAGANSNKTYTVKVVSDSGNKYRFDDFGTSAVTLDLEEGSTYVFDQSDSSNATHPLRFATAADAAGGTEYTSGVTTTGTPGQAGAKTTITVASGAPTLYYYCSNHSGMGGQVNTNSTAGASNLAGSIQSTVRVNPEIGFSIVTASASSAGDSIGHGLNAAPSLIIAKRTGATSHWPIYHSSIGANGFLYLNLTNLAGTGANFWNNSAPTSSVFTVGSDSAVTGGTTVFYCFTSVNQYSSFGSYTGNGSSDGPFVFTGFRPRWIMVKMSSAGGNWDIFDTARDSSNVASNVLRADSSADEFSTPTGTYGIALDALSNGFKLRSGSATNDVNDTGETFIYAAFAEHPFKTARAR